MTEVITIWKLNEVWFKVDCNIEVRYELCDYFQFEMANYKFSPAYKYGRWDGKVRLFNVNKSALHIGLLSNLKIFCEERKYTLCFADSQYGHPEAKSMLSEGDITSFMDSLDIHSGGKKIVPHDYQYRAVWHSLNFQRSVLLSATSSGKSLMLYGISRYATGIGHNVLIVCPTTQLVEQMAGDFEDYSSNTNWDAKSQIHKIHSGNVKNTPKPITISTWQALVNMDASWFSKFSTVIVDEVHNAKAKSIQGILEKCTEAKIRVGLTGSLDKSQTNKLLIQALLGDVIKISSSRDLIDKGLLTDIKITAIMFDYALETKKYIKDAKFDYKKEVDFLVAHKKRNNFIANLAVSKKQNTLIFFSYIEHGKELFRLIKEKAPEKTCYFISGDVKVDARESARMDIENSDDVIIVASSQTTSTGVNFKNLHNIIFAFPTKSVIRVLQSIGRGLRKLKGKTIVNVFDIGDNLNTSKVKKNHTYKHFVERLKIYAEEDFPYKLLEMALEK